MGMRKILASDKYSLICIQCCLSLHINRFPKSRQLSARTQNDGAYRAGILDYQSPRGDLTANSLTNMKARASRAEIATTHPL